MAVLAGSRVEALSKGELLGAGEVALAGDDEDEVSVERLLQRGKLLLGESGKIYPRDSGACSDTKIMKSRGVDTNRTLTRAADPNTSSDS